MVGTDAPVARLDRELVLELLFRGPGTLESRAVRAAASGLAAVGGSFLIWSAVIHLKLWADGYRDISVIGPLFLVQGIACIAVGTAVVALRWLALLAAGAVLGAATAVGLLLSAYVGLFGFTESLAVPYATLSLAVELTAAFVLLTGTVLLAFAAPASAPAGGAGGTPAAVLRRGQ